MGKEIPKEFLETDDTQTWRACLFCGGELVQVRKALFGCLKCNQEFIADEEDMKEEKPLQIFKLKKEGDLP